MKSSINVDGIIYYREHPELEKAKKAIEKYDWLVGDIRSARENAQALYDDMKKQGFQFGSVEAEGYLRAMVQVEETINYIEKMVGGESLEGSSEQ